MPGVIERKGRGGPIDVRWGGTMCFVVIRFSDRGCLPKGVERKTPRTWKMAGPRRFRPMGNVVKIGSARNTDDETRALALLERGHAEISEAQSVFDWRRIREVSECTAKTSRRLGLIKTARVAATMVLRCDRLIGEWLKTAPKHAGGRPSKTAAVTAAVSTLDDLGIDEHDSRRWQKIAGIDEDVFEAFLADETQEPTQAAALRLTHTSGADDYDGDEWYTPAKYVDAARAVMGSIDLDPASNAHAQKTVRATRFFTAADDGLVKPWTGAIFCNPPYSTDLVQRFAAKLLAEVAAKRCTQAIFLVNNCTDTTWFHSLLDVPVCFTRGRIGFENRKGQAFATRQGQAFFYFGGRQKRFARVFGDLGRVLHAVAT